MLAPARQIVRFRSLLLTLASRELKARYRGSVLGFFWSLANPLLLLAVYTFVFAVVFQPRVPGMDPYALFLITGLFPWVWISTSLIEGTLSLATNAPLIRKAAFPAELLPAVSVVSNLVHFAFAVPVMAVALGGGRLLGFEVGGWTGLLLPLVVALQIPMVTGLALGLAALNVHFKDVRDLIQHLLTLLFFMTPILYSLEAIPIAVLRKVVRVNPFTPFLLAYQDTLFSGRVPALSVWLHMGVVSLVCWMAGAWIFGRLEETLVEAV